MTVTLLFLHHSSLMLLIIPVLLLGTASVALYRSFASPLSRRPVIHPLAACTSLYMLYVRYTSKENQSVYLAHQRLGPVVRLGPNELSISCVDDGIRTIYQNPAFEKTQFYSFFVNYGRLNMMSSLTPEHHGARRKRISNIYSKSHLQSSTDLEAITRVVLQERMLPDLLNHASAATPLDIMQLFQAVAMDVATSYFFGLRSGTNFLQDKASRSRWLEFYSRSRPRGFEFLLQELPALSRLCGKLGFHVVPESREVYVGRVEAWILDMCDGAEATCLDADVTPGDRAVVYAQLKKAVEKQGYSNVKSVRPSCLDPESQQADTLHSPQQLEIASELLDHIVATQDTLNITLTYIAWELSRHAEAQSRLREELRRGGSDKDSRSLLNAKVINDLPFLHAIVMETMRLHPAIAGPQPRFTPRHGTVNLGGFEGIPPGVRVQAYGWSLHKNADVFPEPLSWRPERWLDTDKQWQGSDTKERWFWGFGSGGRTCVGSNFAMQVMKAIIAVMYAELESYVVDDQGIEQGDGFVAAPKSGKLIVGLRRVAW